MESVRTSSRHRSQVHSGEGPGGCCCMPGAYEGSGTAWCTRFVFTLQGLRCLVCNPEQTPTLHGVVQSVTQSRPRLRGAQTASVLPTALPCGSPGRKVRFLKRRNRGTGLLLWPPAVRACTPCRGSHFKAGRLSRWSGSRAPGDQLVAGVGVRLSPSCHILLRWHLPELQ